MSQAMSQVMQTKVFGAKKVGYYTIDIVLRFGWIELPSLATRELNRLERILNY